MAQAYSSIFPAFKGNALVKKYRVQGERLIQTSEVAQDNIVNKRALELLLMSNQAVFNNSRRIAISTNSYTPDYERTTVANIIAIGAPSLAGVSGYTFAEKTETTPRAVTYHNRFLTPSSARDFTTIALVDGTTNNNTANITANAYAYLSFASPVTQASNEIIDIFYKVYIEWTSDPINLNENFQDELEYLFLAQITSGLKYEENNLCEEIHSLSNSDRALRWRAVDNNVRVTRFSANYTQRTGYLKREYTATASFDMDRHYFGISYGRLERSGSNLYGFKGTAGIVPIKMPSALGNVFSHSASASALFYDSNALANSSWKPSVTDIEKRTDDLPSLYTLKVESSGGEGIGTYSVYKTIYSGGRAANTTWQQTPRPLVITSKYPYFVPEDDDIPYNSKWIYYWVDDTQWVSANETTVAIWRIYPSFEVVNSWDLAASHGVATINDLATDEDNQLIYVATESGLFQINVVADTVTQLSTDKAKAVDMAYNSNVFAVLINSSNVGRLASTLNATWDDAHSFSGSINWANVLFIRCARASADYNLAILEYRYNPNGGVVYASLWNSWFAKIHWWNNTSNYVSTIECQQQANSSAYYWHKSFLFPYNSSFVVKDGLWFYPKFVRGGFSMNGGYPRSWHREQVKAFSQSGINLIASNGQFSNVSYSIVGYFDVGVAQFNKELRRADYSGGIDSYGVKYPCFAVLDTDVSSGWVSVCIASYFYYTATSGNYDSSALPETVGCYDLEVSETDSTVNGIRGYKNTGVNAFYFTYRNYGSGSLGLYYLGGSPMVAKGGGLLNFMDTNVTSALASNWGNTYNGHPKGNKFTNTFYHPIMISVWGGYNRSWQEQLNWSTRYGWNDTTSAWEKDPDGVLPGKALHTASETLVDGLELSWSDLNPAETRDLVAGQFYTFTRIPGDTGFVQDGTYSTVPIEYSYYLRPVVLYPLNETIPASPYQLTLSPVSDDPLWLSLDIHDPSVIELALAGYAVNATVITSGTPAANEILLADAPGGILEFNSADEGKAVSGTVLYMKKIHETEVL